MVSISLPRLLVMVSGTARPVVLVDFGFAAAAAAATAFFLGGMFECLMLLLLLTCLRWRRV